MKKGLNLLLVLLMSAPLSLFSDPLQLEFDESAYCQYQFTKDKGRRESILHKISQYATRSTDYQKFKLDKKASAIECDERACIEHIYAKSKLNHKPKDKVVVHYMRSFTYRGTQNPQQNLLICAITKTFGELLSIVDKDQNKNLLKEERGGENRKIIFQSQTEQYSYPLSDLKKKEKKVEKYLQKAKDSN